MTGPIRIVVVDDHPLLLDGLVATLSADEELDVVGTAGDAASAVRAARDLQPDIALLDVAMPGGGIEAARQIGPASPATRVVMLTSSENEDDLLAAMEAGAKGYVLKGVAGRELRAILKSVHGGEVYVAPGLAYAMIKGLTKPRSAIRSRSSRRASARSSSSSPPASRTPRSAVVSGSPRRP